MPPLSAAPVLPEMKEAEAPDHIRAIYEDIRRLSAVPMAALIYRNLATHPGVLEEIWAAIGPLFRAGRIQEAAWCIARDAMPADLLPAIRPHARAVLGLTGAALDQVRDTLDAYNRANPVNALAMLTLAARLTRDGAAKPLPETLWTPPERIPGPLPDMTPPDAIAVELRLLINDLGPGDRSTLDPIVPSLYRHLVAWPGYLAAHHVTLVPRLRDGSLMRLAQDVLGAMVRDAKSLAEYLPPLPQLAATGQAVQTMAHFSTTTIPLMIVVGKGMRDALA
jgi:hypothetical protein